MDPKISPSTLTRGGRIVTISLPTEVLPCIIRYFVDHEIEQEIARNDMGTVDPDE